MPSIYRFPSLALGALERDVLEALWTSGPLNPKAVHSVVGEARGISVNTVSSALTRLNQKGFLKREKVSHAYVYRAVVSRSELQRHLIGEITEQFGDGTGAGFLAAFVDLADKQSDETLRHLEQLIAERLRGGD